MHQTLSIQFIANSLKTLKQTNKKQTNKSSFASLECLDEKKTSNAAEVDVFATFHVLMHVEIDMFKNILFPYSVSHLRKLYTMCAGLVGPKTMEIAEAIIDLMEQRYVNFILLHHKEKR